MSGTAISDKTLCEPKFPPRLVGLEILIIFTLFACYASSPTPDVNETHYLCKAKHFWNPDWCPGDLFLDSADAHVVFYGTFGWLTSFAPLSAVAWIGRISLWFGLAVAWRTLSATLVPRAGISILTAALWLLGLHYCHMMGEWVVGTIEGKSVAYICVLFGLTALVRNQWNRLWIWLGTAAMFHVVVGGWSVIAAGIAWLLQGSLRPSWRSMWPGIFAGFLFSLPGLIPALWLTQGVPETTIEQAENIYVFRRLPHHLVVHTRPAQFVIRHLMLVTVWGVLCTVLRNHAPTRRLQTFVAGAVLIALAGALINLVTLQNPESAARWLRYYWYRLSDASVPVGASLGLAVWLTDKNRKRWNRPIWLATLLCVLAATIGLVSRWPTTWTTQLPRASLHEWNFGGHNSASALHAHREWIQLCKWVEQNTAVESQFLTPPNQQTFKWYAGRSEAATWKDIPQDAQSTVTWWNRITAIYLAQPPQLSATASRSWKNRDLVQLFALAREYHCQYIVLDGNFRSSEIDSNLLVYPTAERRQTCRFQVLAVPTKPQPFQPKPQN